MKTTFFKYGIVALTMAFALTLCFSCSKEDLTDETTSEEPIPPSNGVFPGLELGLNSNSYDISVDAKNFHGKFTINQMGSSRRLTQTNVGQINVGDTLTISFSPNRPDTFSVSFQPEDMFEWIEETDQLVVLKADDGNGGVTPTLTISIPFRIGITNLSKTNSNTIELPVVNSKNTEKIYEDMPNYQIIITGKNYHGMFYIGSTSQESSGQINIGDTLTISFEPERPDSYDLSFSPIDAFKWIAETDQLVVLKETNNAMFTITVTNHGFKTARNTFTIRTTRNGESLIIQNTDDIHVS